MTELIEVNVATLSGEALGWAVGKAEGLGVLLAPPVYGNPWRVFVRYAGEVTTRDVRYVPQESWADGGPLIDKYQLTVSSPLASVHRHGGPNAGWGPSNNWSACTWTKGVTGRRAIGHHETSALVAACRAIVAARLGDTVQVPKELICAYCYVTRILGEPYRKFGHWWVEAEYESEGRPGKTQLMFRTKEAALAVTAGHVFQA